MVYRSLAEDPANVYSLLLVAGYLKTPKKELQPDGGYLCEVSIPNKESLYANDVARLQKAITEYMDKSISFYDAGAEGFYHGLTLGLIALLDNQYKIKSNRESGDTICITRNIIKCKRWG